MDDILEPTWLRNRMDETGITGTSLVKASGVSAAQVTRIRAGSPARSDTLRKLRDAIATLSGTDAPNRGTRADDSQVHGNAS